MDFILTFDFDKLTVNDLAEIIKILKYSPSLVNPDILDIADEIILRFSKNQINYNIVDLLSIKEIYNSLKKIPHSKEKQSIIYNYYYSIVNHKDLSPASSPVKPPTIYLMNESDKSPIKVKLPKFMKKCHKKKDI